MSEEEVVIENSHCGSCPGVCGDLVPGSGTGSGSFLDPVLDLFLATAKGVRK